MYRKKTAEAVGVQEPKRYLYIYIYIIHKYLHTYLYTYKPTLYTRHDDEDRGAARAQYPISSAAAPIVVVDYNNTYSHTGIIYIIYICEYTNNGDRYTPGGFSRCNLSQCPQALFQSSVH